VKRKRTTKPHPRILVASHGFTLVELAISIFIIALLLGSILVPLATQVEQRQVSDTQNKQDEIKEALIGFALANAYFPCPAVSAANGQEGPRVAGVCTPRAGFLPWEALGMHKADAWARLYRYSVTPAFANNTTPFTLTTVADITVNTRDVGGAITGLTAANSVPAIVISHGKNGYGGTGEQGNLLALPPLAGPPPIWPANYPDENTNATGTTTFVSRTPQAPGAGGAGGEFDDVVIWVPRFVLLNRMVAAGKIP
jgi:prepilin-type N-terminal cleavage/methylation domain-containing protein